MTWRAIKFFLFLTALTASMCLSSCGAPPLPRSPQPARRRPTGRSTARPRLPTSLPRYRTGRPSGGFTTIGGKCAPSFGSANNLQPQSHSSCEVADSLPAPGDWSRAPQGEVRRTFFRSLHPHWLQPARVYVFKAASPQGVLYMTP
jgi:hypothetical protein